MLEIAPSSKGGKGKIINATPTSYTIENTDDDGKVTWINVSGINQDDQNKKLCCNVEIMDENKNAIMKFHSDYVLAVNGDKTMVTRTISRFENFTQAPMDMLFP